MDQQLEIEMEEPTEVRESSSLSTQGRSNDDNTWRLLLYKNVVEGDWDKTKIIIILHTAIIHNHVNLVVELVKMMPKEDLELTLPYRTGATALHLAALGGIMKIAEVLVEKNDTLLCLKDEEDYLPITRASFSGNKAMVHYLYSRTPENNINQSISNGVNLLINAIVSEDYDFALKIHRRFPEFTFAQNDSGITALEVLAERPFAFPSGNQLKFWQRWIYNCIDVQQSHGGNSEGSIQKKVVYRLKELSWDAVKILAPGIKDTQLKYKQAFELLTSMSSQVSTLNVSDIEGSGVLNAMVAASEFGIVEFVVKMVKSNPTLLWISAQSRSIFHVAVAHRRERIWNLIYGLGAQGVEIATFVRSSDGFTLLHQAAELAPSSRLNNVSGPAMQLQWELQWFKEVESIVPALFKGRLNKERKTARAMFTKEHKDLVKEAEKWMKGTASSCMVVTTLIATVMFAAAFTVPGGNDNQKGIPVLLKEKSFMVFIIADALSLFSSTTSILIFLSILTSRYAEEDFLRALPKRLIIGLATLFFSIATMMVAFSATLVIVLNHQYQWVAIPVSCLASVPVSLFALLQFPLFVDIVVSTYGSSIFRMQTETLVPYDVEQLVDQFVEQMARNKLRKKEN